MDGITKLKHEFEQVPGVGEGQGSLVCCTPWGRKESDSTATEEMDREGLGSVVKDLLANAGDLVSVPGLGRSPGEGNGNSLQYSCLENPMDKGAWGAAIHVVAKSQTRLSKQTHSHTKPQMEEEEEPQVF